MRDNYFLNLKHGQTGKWLRVILSTIIFTLVITQSFAQYPAGSPVAINGRLRVEGVDLVNECGNPVQLRGMSTHGVQWFANCINTSSMNALKTDWGADIIRLAMYVESDGYKSNPTYWKNWIDTKVDEIGALGLYVLIDWHILSDGNPLTNLSAAQEFWTYMSQKHAGKKHVLYEICNEPNGAGGTWANIRTYANDIIPRIRANDPNTVIIVGTPNWSQDVDIACSNKLNYSNLMYTLHFYSGSHGQTLRNKANTARANGCAVFVTEFGLSAADGNGGVFIAESDNWMTWMQTNKISWCNWSFCDKNETSAALAPGACGGSWNNTSQSGTYVKNKMLTPADNFVSCNISGVSVTLATTPVASSIFSEGDAISLNANPTTTAGSITKVDFYRGTTLLGTDNTSPYSFNVSNLTAGSHSFRVVATNSSGQTGEATTTIRVNKALFRTSTPPVIDGVAEAVWNLHNVENINNVLQGTFTAADLSANWKAMWDNTNLYVLVDVTDDLRVNDAGTDTYNDDEVEIYFDYGNKKRTTYGATDYQFTFRWNDLVLVRENSGKPVTGIERVFSNKATGYVLEVKIPWSTIGGNPALNQLHGFDVMVNDDDNGAARDGKIAWASTVDNTWQNPSLMGTVVLKEATCSMPGTAGTITGSATVCANATRVNYSIPEVTGATSYNWTIPQGATITAGAGTRSITVSFGSTGGTISVTPVNACGNGTANSLAVTVNSVPSAAGTISGSATLCANATGINYSIPEVTGATSYNWTVPQGATITAGAGTRSITVSFATTGGNISVTPVNTCGNGTTSSLVVAVNSVPSAAGTISGSATVCANATGINYSIPEVTGATSYNWTIPQGATITAGAGTRSITVSFGLTGGNISVTPVNACGNGTESSLAVAVNSVPSAAGTISGSATVCANATRVNYSIPEVTGATSYNWTIPQDATITAGAGTRSITVSFGTTGGTISVTPVNTCGNGTTSSLAVAVNSVPSAAGTISGSATVCANATGVNYSIPEITGATSYNWTVPQGASITDGAGTRNITVSFGSAGGSISVTPVNACGNGTASSLTIAISSSIGTTGTISGSASVCANSTGTYSIPEVAGATSYNWSVPQNAIITAGTGTRSITVSFGTTGGNISVTPSGSCSNGTASSMTVTVNPAPASAGTISGSASVCNNATGIHYSIAQITGAISYNWSVPQDAIITAGAGTNNIIVSFGTSGGNVMVVPVFSCGNGTSSSLPVSITPVVTKADAGADQYISGTIATLDGNNPSEGTGSWTRLNGSGTISNSLNPSTTVTGLSDGINTFRWTISNTCGASSDEVVVYVGSAPSVNEINGSDNVVIGQFYTYSISAEQGVSYNWIVPTGAEIVSGQGTNSIQVVFNTETSGDIIVETTNEFGTTTINKPVTIGSEPAIGSIVNGPENVIAGQRYTYSVPEVLGANYEWVVPNGATIISGHGTNSIDVEFSNGSSGNVSVLATNNFGSSNASVSVNVEERAEEPVVEISGPSTVVPGQEYTYTVPEEPGTTYNWEVPTGATIVSGQGTNSIVVRIDSEVNGNITLDTSNPTSGNSSVSTPVNTAVVAPAPEVIVGPTVVQSGNRYTYTVPNNPGSSYNWSVPEGATIVSGQGTNEVVVEFGPRFDGNISVTESNSAGSASVSLDVRSNDITSIIGKGRQDSFDVYPNPFQSETNFRVNTPGQVKLSLTITDAKGITVAQLDEVNSNEIIQLGENLNCGIFFVQIKYENTVKVLKIVKY